MTKIGKVIAFAIIVMVLGMPLAAQFVQDEPASLESNTSRATAGLFGNDIDDFMDTRSWSGVTFDKWFGFATGEAAAGTRAVTSGKDNPDNPDLIGKASLGYARRFGSLYLGAWYNGNILQVRGDTEPNVTKEIIGTDNIGAQTQSQTKTTTTYSPAWVNSTNQLSLLLGIGNAGFKVGFFESMTTDKNPSTSGYDAAGNPRSIIVTDTKDGFKTYENKTEEYSFFGGHIRPSLGWGTTIAGSLAIKPYVDIGFDIYQEKKIDSSKNTITYNGKTIGLTTTNHAGWNNGYFAPDIVIGADFDKEGEAVSTSFGIEYGLNLRVYDNNYDNSGISGSAAGTVTWDNSSTSVDRTYEKTKTTTTAELAFEDTTYWNHAITPSYTITGETANGLQLGFSAAVPVGIELQTQDKYTNTYTKEKEIYNNNVNKARNITSNILERENNGLDETTTFNIAATVAVGASYKLIPNRFTVNAGISATPLAYTNTTVKTSPNGVKKITTSKTVDGNGVVLEDNVTVVDREYLADTVEFTETWQQFSGAATAGFVFEFAPQLFLDLNAGVYGFDIKATEVNILFGFRF